MIIYLVTLANVGYMAFWGSWLVGRLDAVNWVVVFVLKGRLMVNRSPTGYMHVAVIIKNLVKYTCYTGASWETITEK